ncbi:MAG: septum formation protein Maf [Verrucomicrobiae bacterium]|nr:septum formation protein Maf [Verrucomicrobiae bacterium]
MTGACQRGRRAPSGAGGGVDLILASASPRRARLLRSRGIRFEVVPAAVDEIGAGEPPRLSPGELAAHNAWLKAADVARTRPAAIVVGCDTVVALGARALGKPRDPGDARAMLRLLSGRVHAVISAVAIIGPSLPGGTRAFREVTLVRFRALSDADIAAYLARVHVLDKAGAYALQEHGRSIVEAIRGPADNVVGLPVDRLLQELAHLGNP